MMKKLLFSYIVLFFSLFTFAQNNDSIQKINPLSPKLDGSLKTKLEFNLENGKMRFEVRNARFGTKGNINKYFGYRAEVDLSDEGKIKMLDAYVKVTPINNLEIYLGQRKVPFGTDYFRNPVENLFANRSFVAKYVNDGLRDIGFAANYKFHFHIPFDIWVSAMNGTGNNNPQWIEQPNYSARIIIYPIQHIRVAANFYQGSSLLEKKLRMFGGELRYENQHFLLESEYLQRHFTDTSNVAKYQDALYIHALYSFKTHKKMIQYINPVARYDYMGKELYKEIMAERFTAGVNFGFFEKPFVAEIRLNYEKYFKGSAPSHFDKFVIELIAKF